MGGGCSGESVSQWFGGKANTKAVDVCGSFQGRCFCVCALVMCMCGWEEGGGVMPLFFSLGSGVGSLTMGWRFGCINKLPYSKLSAVTGAKGLVISLVSLREGGSLCGDNFQPLLFSNHSSASPEAFLHS